jgi:4a-hydroxytetrahydrobiopterin dehydratase
MSEQQWQVRDGWLEATFETGSFMRGLELVQRVAEAAERANHHPDVELTYPSVRFRLISHDVGEQTERDERMAAEITDLAAEMGIEGVR